jgi:hypothetical protein
VIDPKVLRVSGGRFLQLEKKETVRRHMFLLRQGSRLINNNPKN